jgi:prevent-host-death family protein
MKQKIGAGEFKAKCLSLLDQVEKTRQEIVVTKRGRPVAKVVPIEQEKPQLWGRMAGTFVILGDIVSPIEDAGWDEVEKNWDDLNK